ncbi:WecB/TagA/CpsF family glycosyltransferase [Priestia megaterium]|uniref:WecB/TagA/CpsF family glycosyltransferase n=1 Tax=Priestia megaterium TaxID=1404 RepID=A0A6M6E6L2_PRIMG|nr:WecB/TagA/CpsF family glycosyltransferase [Priestia megaterium]QJX80167.1 WecB/TagA/CpsF family glycosyltransferase [Priestia megaterium]
MKENIRGFDVTTLGYSELKHQLLNDINEDKKSFIVAINPEKIMHGTKDQELKELLNSATYQIPDGHGIVVLSKRQGGNIKERVTGCDLFQQLCELAAKEGKKVFLYGAKPGVAEQTKSILEQRYSGLNVVGTLDGFVMDKTLIIDTINNAKPDFLFVALGSPAQEKWIKENMDQLDAHIFQGVGGSFDVVSGNIKRAPKWMQKMGLEWLHRVILEPKRVVRIIRLSLFLARGK